MQIKKNLEGKTFTVELIGRLDAVTSIELGKSLKNFPEDMEEIIFDLSKLDYIASAGLRLLLKCQKLMDKNLKQMKIKNATAEVRDILDNTGFSDFLHIVDKDSTKKLSIEF